MRVNRCVVTVHPGVYKVRVKNTFKRKTFGGRENYGENYGLKLPSW